MYSVLVGGWHSLKMLPCNILREFQTPTNSEYTIKGKGNQLLIFTKEITSQNSAYSLKTRRLGNHNEMMTKIKCLKMGSFSGERGAAEHCNI